MSKPKDSAQVDRNNSKEALPEAYNCKEELLLLSAHHSFFNLRITSRLLGLKLEEGVDRIFHFL